jgi:hypothetical protein
MSLIHGQGGKCPCPICLVPSEELHDLSKTFQMRSVKQGKDGLQEYKKKKSHGEEILKAIGL